MNNKTKKEEELTLELLDAIDRQNNVSQRYLAQQMGVALGMANSYLKRCVRKGYIKMRQAPANRYLYYLTPTGFAEKSRLTGKYLSYSFLFYRKAGKSCNDIYYNCQTNGWLKIMLCGVSDLAEIAALRAIEMNVDILGVYDPESEQKYLASKPVVNVLNDTACDAYIVTDMEDPADTYLRLSRQVDRDRIFIPDVLGLTAGDLYKIV